jgi:hypothetical protein
LELFWVVVLVENFSVKVLLFCFNAFGLHRRYYLS